MMFFCQTLLYFFAAVFGHAVLCRLPVAGNFVIKFAVSGALTGLALITNGAMAAVLTYAFLCELYLFFFTFARSSVSVSLLFMLKAGERSEEEIHRFYAQEEMVSRRIQRLVAEGFLKAGSTGHELTPRGRRLLSFFRGMKRFFRHAS